jgi:hypothetical protein
MVGTRLLHVAPAIVAAGATHASPAALPMLPVPSRTSPPPAESSHHGRPRLGDVVGSFKSAATRHANSMRVTPDILWQRGYYDHVIRDNADLSRIRQYIEENPSRWAEDTENPLGVNPVTHAEARVRSARRRATHASPLRIP